jgi:hypothetical protein
VGRGACPVRRTMGRRSMQGDSSFNPPATCRRQRPLGAAAGGHHSAPQEWRLPRYPGCLSGIKQVLMIDLLAPPTRMERSR